jgi:hypothetical protein
MSRWSAGYQWVDRVAAWDADQDRLLRLAMTKEREQFARRLAASGALAQAKALAKIRSFVDRIDRDGGIAELREGQSYTDTMTVSDATRLLEVGARLEAIGRGVPDGGTVPAPQPVNVIVGNPILAAIAAQPSKASQALAMLEQLAQTLGIEDEPRSVIIDGDVEGDEPADEL